MERHRSQSAIKYHSYTTLRCWKETYFRAFVVNFLPKRSAVQKGDFPLFNVHKERPTSYKVTRVKQAFPLLGVIECTDQS